MEARLYGTNTLAFTAKCRTSAYQTITSYEWLIKHWKKLANVTHWSYEKDKRGRLHIHGIIESPDYVKYRTYQHPQFMVHIKPLRTKADKDAWMDYCQKDQDILEESEHYDPPKKSLFK